MKRNLLSLLFFLTFFAAGTDAQVSISGQLLKSNAKPLAYTEIELVPVGSDKIINDPRLIAISATSGRFTFSKVPPGKYTLSINFDDKPTELSPYQTFFYPNTSNRSEAEVFDITAASKIRNLLFRLPPALSLKKITGRVVFADEKAAGGAFVFAKDVDFDKNYGFERDQTDINGNFTIPGFEGRNYQLGAILFENPAAKTPLELGGIVGAVESKVFRLDQTTAVQKMILIELQEKKDYDRLRDKYIGWLETDFFEDVLTKQIITRKGE